MRRARGPGAPKAPPEGREALDAAPVRVHGTSRRAPAAETTDDSRALRRRVTLIYGGYHERSRQSTQDSASSGGRAVYVRELGPQSVSHGRAADPHNRASVHPSSSRADTKSASLSHLPSCRPVLSDSARAAATGGGCNTAQRKPDELAGHRHDDLRRVAYGARARCGSADRVAVALCRQSRSPAAAARCRRRASAVPTAGPC